MTFRDMQILIQVADSGKMSDAARKLSISQSSVSQVIANIEREYQVRLFERLSRKLYLTPAGKSALDYVRHILAMQNTLEEHLTRPDTLAGTRIGATITVGNCVILAIIEELRRADPKFYPELVIANTHLLEERLLKSELDIALVEGRVGNPDLVSRPVIDDRLVVTCGREHPLFGKKTVSLEELAGCPLILREPGSGTRAQLENELVARAIPYRVVLESYSENAIRRAVIGGYGVTVISELLIKDEVEAGALWSCRIDGFPMERSFSLVYHKDKFITEDISRFISASQIYGMRKAKAEDNP